MTTETELAVRLLAELKDRLHREKFTSAEDLKKRVNAMLSEYFYPGVTVTADLAPGGLDVVIRVQLKALDGGA